MAAQLQVEPAMAREQLQHVIEEADPGADVVAALAVEREPQRDLCLGGLPVDRGSPHRTSSSAAMHRARVLDHAGGDPQAVGAAADRAIGRGRDTPRSASAARRIAAASAESREHEIGVALPVGDAESLERVVRAAPCDCADLRDIPVVVPRVRERGRQRGGSADVQAVRRDDAAQRRDRLRHRRPPRRRAVPASPYALANVRPTTTFAESRRPGPRSASRRRSPRTPRRRTPSRAGADVAMRAMASRGIALAGRVVRIGQPRRARVRVVIAASTSLERKREIRRRAAPRRSVRRRHRCRPRTCRTPGRRRSPRACVASCRAAPPSRPRGCLRRGRWSARTRSGRRRGARRTAAIAAS